MTTIYHWLDFELNILKFYFLLHNLKITTSRKTEFYNFNYFSLLNSLLK